MPYDSGTLTIGTPGTALQLSSSLVSNAIVRASQKIISLEVTPREGNSGVSMYLGTVGVSNTNGRQILKGVSHSVNLDPTTMKFSNWYADADSGGDEIDWEVLWI